MSCNASPELELHSTHSTSDDLPSYSFKNGMFEPENGSNIYDEAGLLHNALFEAYYDGTVKDTSLLAIVEQVNRLANENSKFVGLSPFAYEFDDLNKMRGILDNPLLVRSHAVNASIQNSEVASDFLTFLNTIETLCNVENDYDLIYAEIRSYESSILTDPRVNAHDMEIILTTTSIIRYSTCKRKKRPKKNTDPEWDLLIANMTGAVSGSTESMQDAVVLSLVAGIAANK